MHKKADEVTSTHVRQKRYHFLSKRKCLCMYVYLAFHIKFLIKRTVCSILSGPYIDNLSSKMKNKYKMTHIKLLRRPIDPYPFLTISPQLLERYHIVVDIFFCLFFIFLVMINHLLGRLYDLWATKFTNFFFLCYVTIPTLRYAPSVVAVSPLS